MESMESMEIVDSTETFNSESTDSTEIDSVDSIAIPSLDGASVKDDTLPPLGDENGKTSGNSQVSTPVIPAASANSSNSNVTSSSITNTTSLDVSNDILLNSTLDSDNDTMINETVVVNSQGKVDPKAKSYVAGTGVGFVVVITLVGCFISRKRLSRPTTTRKPPNKLGPTFTSINQEEDDEEDDDEDDIPVVSESQTAEIVAAVQLEAAVSESNQVV